MVDADTFYPGPIADAFDRHEALRIFHEADHAFITSVRAILVEPEKRNSVELIGQMYELLAITLGREDGSQVTYPEFIAACGEVALALYQPETCLKQAIPFS